MIINIPPRGKNKKRYGILVNGIVKSEAYKINILRGDKGQELKTIDGVQTQHCKGNGKYAFEYSYASPFDASQFKALILTLPSHETAIDDDTSMGFRCRFNNRIQLVLARHPEYAGTTPTLADPIRTLTIDCSSTNYFKGVYKMDISDINEECDIGFILSNDGSYTLPNGQQGIFYSGAYIQSLQAIK